VRRSGLHWSGLIKKEAFAANKSKATLAFQNFM